MKSLGQHQIRPYDTKCAWCGDLATLIVLTRAWECEARKSAEVLSEEAGRSVARAFSR